MQCDDISLCASAMLRYARTRYGGARLQRDATRRARHYLLCAHCHARLLRVISSLPRRHVRAASLIAISCHYAIRYCAMRYAMITRLPLMHCLIRRICPSQEASPVTCRCRDVTFTSFVCYCHNIVCRMRVQYLRRYASFFIYGYAMRFIFHFHDALPRLLMPYAPVYAMRIMLICARAPRRCRLRLLLPRA